MKRGQGEKRSEEDKEIRIQVFLRREELVEKRPSNGNWNWK